MSFTAKSVMQSAQTILQDAGSVRWPLTEILRWINAATREIALVKPDATSSTITINLVSGTKQSLPSGYHQLLAVTRNVASGRAVLPISRELMDMQFPGWHKTETMPFSVDVAYVINNPQDQSVFYVAPGNNASGQIEAIVSAMPAPIAEPASPLNIDSYSANVPVPDIYESAVLDYVLYRCFSKDINVPGIAQRAQAHFVQFQNALGIKQATEATKNPDAPQSRFSH